MQYVMDSPLHIKRYNGSGAREKIIVPASQKNDEIGPLQDQMEKIQKKMKTLEVIVRRRLDVVMRQTKDILEEQDAIQMKIKELDKASAQTPTTSSASRDSPDNDQNIDVYVAKDSAVLRTNIKTSEQTEDQHTSSVHHKWVGPDLRYLSSYEADLIRFAGNQDLDVGGRPDENNEHRLTLGRNKNKEATRFPSERIYKESASTDPPNHSRIKIYRGKCDEYNN